MHSVWIRSNSLIRFSATAHKSRNIFIKMGHSRPLFLYFRLFYKQITVNMFNKSSRWLDSNPGPLVLEANTLSTVPQPLPKLVTFLDVHRKFNVLIFRFLKNASLRKSKSLSKSKSLWGLFMVMANFSAGVTSFPSV